MFFYSIKTQLLLKTWGGSDSMNGPPSASWADEFHYLLGALETNRKVPVVWTAHRGSRLWQTTFAPLLFAMNRGEGGVKERKYVSVQANQDKATDEKKSQKKWKEEQRQNHTWRWFCNISKKISGFFQSARLLWSASAHECKKLIAK